MKIVSLTPSATEIIASLDLSDNLVGCSHECNFPEEIKEKLKVTSSKIRPSLSMSEIDNFVKESQENNLDIYEINQNMLANIQPDYLVTQGLCDVCAITEGQVEQVLKRLINESGKVTKVLSLSGSSIEQIIQDIKRLGHEFDRIAQAEEIIGTANKTIQDMMTFSKTGKSILFLEWVDPFFGPGHWVPEQIMLAGFDSALGLPGQHSEEIPPSLIRTINPDYIVVGCCGFGLEDNKRIGESLYSNVHLRGLKAMLDHNVYAFDADSYFSRPTLRILEGVNQLREALLTESLIHRCAL